MVQTPDLGERGDLSEFSVVDRPPFRLDEDESATPSGPDPGQVGPEESIGGPKRDAPSRALAPKNEELMAQGEHLGLERGPAAEQGSERRENGQKGRDHRRSSWAQVREILNDDGPDQFLGRHKRRHGDRVDEVGLVMDDCSTRRPTELR